jgi:hypothetical protein
LLENGLEFIHYIETRSTFEVCAVFVLEIHPGRLVRCVELSEKKAHRPCIGTFGSGDHSFCACGSKLGTVPSFNIGWLFVLVTECHDLTSVIQFGITSASDRRLHNSLE